MFLLYYLVTLINFFVYINLKHLNRIYLNFNKFNLIFKKKFDDVSFFEKFILIFFYKKNWFFKSIFNFLNSEVLENYKKKNHPLLNFFSFYNLHTDNKLKNLITLKKIYSFFLKNKFFNINYKFSDFLILQYFFNKKYFNFLNLHFYKNVNLKNFIKLNFLFFFLNKKLFVKNRKYNLNYYNDWFNYLFNNKNVNFKKIKINLDKSFFKKIRQNKINHAKKVLTIYSKLYNFKKTSFIRDLNNFISSFYKKNPFFYKNIIISDYFSKLVKKTFPIRFSESSLNKYINKYNIKNYNFLYLRKNKIFNKSRYSRNRQLYRTGVYWCLWLNIMIVYGLYFIFYRFTFNFGYLWLGLCIMIFSTLFSRITKYEFYNLYKLYNEFYNLFVWFGFLLNNFLINFNLFLNVLKKNTKINFILYNYMNNYFYYFYKFFINFLIYFNKKKDYGYVFIWKNYGVDRSFLKHKSIIHWFGQFYKVLTY